MFSSIILERKKNKKIDKKSKDKIEEALVQFYSTIQKIPKIPKDFNYKDYQCVYCDLISQKNPSDSIRLSQQMRDFHKSCNHHTNEYLLSHCKCHHNSQSEINKSVEIDLTPQENLTQDQIINFKKEYLKTKESNNQNSTFLSKDQIQIKSDKVLEHLKEIYVFLGEMGDEQIEDFDSFDVNQLIDKNRELMIRIVSDEQKFSKFQIQKNDIIWEQKEEENDDDSNSKKKSNGHSRNLSKGTSKESNQNSSKEGNTQVQSNESLSDDREKRKFSDQFDTQKNSHKNSKEDPIVIDEHDSPLIQGVKNALISITKNDIINWEDLKKQFNSMVEDIRKNEEKFKKEIQQELEKEFLSEIDQYNILITNLQRQNDELFNEQQNRYENYQQQEDFYEKTVNKENIGSESELKSLIQKLSLIILNNEDYGKMSEQEQILVRKILGDTNLSLLQENMKTINDYEKKMNKMKEIANQKIQYQYVLLRQVQKHLKFLIENQFVNKSEINSCKAILQVISDEIIEGENFLSWFEIQFEKGTNAEEFQLLKQKLEMKRNESEKKLEESFQNQIQKKISEFTFKRYQPENEEESSAYSEDLEEESEEANEHNQRINEEKKKREKLISEKMGINQFHQLFIKKEQKEIKQDNSIQENCDEMDSHFNDTLEEELEHDQTTDQDHQDNDSSKEKNKQQDIMNDLKSENNFQSGKMYQNVKNGNQRLVNSDSEDFLKIIYSQIQKNEKSLLEHNQLIMILLYLISLFSCEKILEEIHSFKSKTDISQIWGGYLVYNKGYLEEEHNENLREQFIPIEFIDSFTQFKNTNEIEFTMGFGNPVPLQNQPHLNFEIPRSGFNLKVKGSSDEYQKVVQMISGFFNTELIRAQNSVFEFEDLNQEKFLFHSCPSNSLHFLTYLRTYQFLNQKEQFMFLTFLNSSKVFESDYVSISIKLKKQGSIFKLEYELLLHFRDYLLDQLFETKKYKLNHQLKFLQKQSLKTIKSIDRYQLVEKIKQGEEFYIFKGREPSDRNKISLKSFLAYRNTNLRDSMVYNIVNHSRDQYDFRFFVMLENSQRPILQHLTIEGQNYEIKSKNLKKYEDKISLMNPYTIIEFTGQIKGFGSIKFTLPFFHIIRNFENRRLDDNIFELVPSSFIQFSQNQKEYFTQFSLDTSFKHKNYDTSMVFTLVSFYLVAIFFIFNGVMSIQEK